MPLTSATLRRATRHLRRVEPVMGALVARVGACRLTLHREGTAFFYVARAPVRAARYRIPSDSPCAISGMQRYARGCGWGR